MVFSMLTCFVRKIRAEAWVLNFLQQAFLTLCYLAFLSINVVVTFEVILRFSYSRFLSFCISGNMRNANLLPLAFCEQISLLYMCMHLLDMQNTVLCNMILLCSWICAGWIRNILCRFRNLLECNVEREIREFQTSYCCVSALHFQVQATRLYHLRGLWFGFQVA